MLRATMVITAAIFLSLVALDWFFAPEPAAIWNRQVREDQTVGDLVCLLCSATVQGRIEGDLVSVLGNLRVEGSVTGDVVAAGGNVRLGPRAQCGSELVAVGGEVLISEGAQISESPQPVSYLHLPGQKNLLHPGFLIALGAHLAVVFLTALLVRPHQLNRVSELMSARPWRSCIAGMLPGMALWIFEDLPPGPAGTEWIGLGLWLTVSVAWLIGYTAFCLLPGFQKMCPTSGFWGGLLSGALLLFVLFTLPVFGGIFWLAVSLACLGSPFLAVYAWLTGNWPGQGEPAQG